VLPNDPRSACAIAEFKYEEPFASLLGSHKGSMVEVGGFRLGLSPAVMLRVSCAPVRT
jgi:hypothetical protein